MDILCWQLFSKRVYQHIFEHFITGKRVIFQEMLHAADETFYQFVNNDIKHFSSTLLADFIILKESCLNYKDDMEEDELELKQMVLEYFYSDDRHIFKFERGLTFAHIIKQLAALSGLHVQSNQNYLKDIPCDVIRNDNLDLNTIITEFQRLRPPPCNDNRTIFNVTQNNLNEFLTKCPLYPTSSSAVRTVMIDLRNEYLVRVIQDEIRQHIYVPWGRRHYLGVERLLLKSGFTKI
ncbi:unnamed protein product [Didymodactylos carnosus]|uniref:Uncharacterized protein n=1 Tax=Didymodactylos carnosus TaxID=1234261 RepID=A0A815NEC6_9BILA|nr:unnamed protein product [Didymodactylos carnosus]CAF4310979.1 unnamed protein product [Didymodactylos carnosus]